MAGEPATVGAVTRRKRRFAYGRRGLGTVTVVLCLGAPPLAASPLSELIDAMPPNSWVEANLNRFDEVWPEQSQIIHGQPSSVILSWTGAAWDPNADDLYIWGGDNLPYAGNEVYRWRGSTLRWERVSLASDMQEIVPPASGKKQWIPVDGVDNAPAAAETFDLVTFLPLVNRLAVIGGNAYPGNGLQYYREDGITRTGPYFWNPGMADGDKVGGTTGSQVNADLHPSTLGGHMWENRQSVETLEAGLVGPASLANGVTDYATIDGKDVVFVGEYAGPGKLYKYTVNSLAPGDDTWEVVGTKLGVSYSGSGAGAYDSQRNAFVRLANTKLMVWDLNNAGPTNPGYQVMALQPDGQVFTPDKKWGIGFDDLRGFYVLWYGSEDIWKLQPPPGGFSASGWTACKIDVPGTRPPPVLDEVFPKLSYAGVFGKWNYMSDYGTFIGVINPYSGRVWIYKPAATADGDVNQDGVVDAADVLLAGKIALGVQAATPEQAAHMDIAPLTTIVSTDPNACPGTSPDGKLNAADVSLIAQKALGLRSF